jgi:hypothetical protein
MGKKHFFLHEAGLVLKKQKMKPAFLPGVLLIALVARAQVKPIGQTCLSLGAYTPSFNDAFTFNNNPALLGNATHFSAGMYSEKLFYIKEFNSVLVNIAIPANHAGFGVSASWSGTTDYSSSLITLGYGKMLGTKMNVGVLFNRYNLHISGYGNLTSVNYKLSAMIHFSNDFHAGISLSNAKNIAADKTNTIPLPAVFTMGFGYIVSSLCFTTIQVEKKQSEPVNISAGIHYAFDKKLFARAGFNSSTSVYFTGAGFQWHSATIVLIMSVHPVLGITPGIEFLFQGKKTEK